MKTFYTIYNSKFECQIEKDYNFGIAPIWEPDGFEDIRYSCYGEIDIDCFFYNNTSNWDEIARFKSKEEAIKYLSGTLSTYEAVKIDDKYITWSIDMYFMETQKISEEDANEIDGVGLDFDVNRITSSTRELDKLSGIDIARFFLQKKYNQLIDCYEKETFSINLVKIVKDLQETQEGKWDKPYIEKAITNFRIAARFNKDLIDALLKKEINIAEYIDWEEFRK